MPLDPHGRNYRPIVKYQGNQIVCMDKHTFLGVTFDKDMNFVKHYEMITKIITSKIRVIQALSAATCGQPNKQLK